MYDQIRICLLMVTLTDPKFEFKYLMISYELTTEETSGFISSQ